MRRGRQWLYRRRPENPERGVEIRNTAEYGGTKSGNGFVTWIQPYPGPTGAGRGVRTERVRGSFNVASKKQAGSVDPVMVAWQRALFAGE